MAYHSKHKNKIRKYVGKGEKHFLVKYDYKQLNCFFNDNKTIGRRYNEKLIRNTIDETKQDAIKQALINVIPHEELETALSSRLSDLEDVINVKEALQ